MIRFLLYRVVLSDQKMSGSSIVCSLFRSWKIDFAKFWSLKNWKQGNVGNYILNNFWIKNLCIKLFPIHKEIKEILEKCTDFQSSFSICNPKDFFNFRLNFIFFGFLQTSKQSWSLYRLIFSIFSLIFRKMDFFRHMKSKIRFTG